MVAKKKPKTKPKTALKAKSMKATRAKPKKGPAATKKTRVVYKTRRLYRSGKDRILGGVCGGIGEYFDIDPVIVRLLWVLFALAYGIGVLMYIIAWIIIPRNPDHAWKD